MLRALIEAHRSANPRVVTASLLRRKRLSCASGLPASHVHGAHAFSQPVLSRAVTGVGSKDAVGRWKKAWIVRRKWEISGQREDKGEGARASTRMRVAVADVEVYRLSRV